MMLTYEQHQQFYELGYIVLRQTVPSHMIDNALRSINHSLGEEGLNKEDLPRLPTGKIQRNLVKKRFW